MQVAGGGTYDLTDSRQCWEALYSDVLTVERLPPRAVRSETCLRAQDSCAWEDQTTFIDVMWIAALAGST